MKETEETAAKSLAWEKERLMGAAAAIQARGEAGRAIDQYQAAAPKPWAELSIEEKIERTREQVKQLQQSISYLDNWTHEIRRASRRNERNLINHRHAHDDGGKVMLPADGGERDECCGDANAKCCDASAPDPAKVYF